MYEKIFWDLLYLIILRHIKLNRWNRTEWSHKSLLKLTTWNLFDLNPECILNTLLKFCECYCFLHLHKRLKIIGQEHSWSWQFPLQFDFFGHFSLCWASSSSSLFIVVINFGMDIMESFLWSRLVASKDSMLRKVVPAVEPMVELVLEVGLPGAVVTGSNSTKLRIENFFLICVNFSPFWLALSMLLLAFNLGFSWSSGSCSSSPLVTSSSSVMVPGCCSSSTSFMFRSPGIRVVLSICVSRPTVATCSKLSVLVFKEEWERMLLPLVSYGDRGKEKDEEVVAEALSRRGSRSPAGEPRGWRWMSRPRTSKMFWRSKESSNKSRHGSHPHLHLGNSRILDMPFISTAERWS